MQVQVQLWGKCQIDMFDLSIKVRLFPLDEHRLLIGPPSPRSHLFLFWFALLFICVIWLAERIQASRGFYLRLAWLALKGNKVYMMETEENFVAEDFQKVSF